MNVQKGAIFSDDRVYRYALWRKWDARPCVLFIGLNPSTADETADDATVRRCIRFACDWGYGGIYMANIFAFRATKPADMLAAADPIGPENDTWLRILEARCGPAVAAWGVHGTYLGRGDAVRAMMLKLHHLGLTKDGHPRHPLYLPATTLPELWK